MLAIYGIRNCDTMKKAMTWLDLHGITYTFHDYKKSGIDAPTLERWEKRLGWEALLNRRVTTWKKLDEVVRSGINRETALQLMQEQPSLIKRPVVDTGAVLLIGFEPDIWEEQLTT